jgi:hypothetical protein
MKPFKEYLIESGGKLILGANPLQMDTPKKLIKHLNTFSDHIRIEQSENHHKIFDKKSGSLIHTLTKSSSIGPKTAITTLSVLRKHLENIGAIKPNPKETKGIILNRQNKIIKAATKSAIRERSPEEIRDRLEKLRGIVRAKLGEKKAERVKKAIERLSQRT